jgi:hypothetical protein
MLVKDKDLDCFIPHDLNPALLDALKHVYKAQTRNLLLIRSPDNTQSPSCYECYLVTEWKHLAMQTRQGARPQPFHCYGLEWIQAIIPNTVKRQKEHDFGWVSDTFLVDPTLEQLKYRPFWFDSFKRWTTNNPNIKRTFKWEES